MNVYTLLIVCYVEWNKHNVKQIVLCIVFSMTNFEENKKRIRKKEYHHQWEKRKGSSG